MEKRVVITGVGVISSIGIGKDDFWGALLRGESGISEISSFDTGSFNVHYAGEIKDFCPGNYLSGKKLAGLGRGSCLAIAAAKLALEDSRLNSEHLKRHKSGICLGTTMGESQMVERLNKDLLERGVDAINPLLIPGSATNALSANVARELGLMGANLIISNACAAGNFAIGYAYDLIKLGEAGLMLAGGADAFSRLAFIGFSRMFAIAPEKCQPFDKNRKGMMVGEGAGLMVLEPLESAIERKARIYAEILGYGLSCDAHHMTAPHSSGISKAIENALLESKVSPVQVDYVSAHGTGTLTNDREECLAFKKVFGADYKKIPISSVKSMLGHSMGAASAIGAVVCSLAIKDEAIPPTINYETPDPECDIDCVPNASRGHKINIALNNASAFGGNNSCLVLKKYAS